MNVTIVTMIINLSHSLRAIKQLLFGAAYVCGIALVIAAIWKWHDLINERGGSAEGQKSMILFMLLSGIGLIFLPSSMEVLSVTAFGASQSLLQYTDYNPYNLNDAMLLLIQTVGVLWFFWGMILLARAGHPNSPGGERSSGAKALGYLCAGICAMNFQSTLDMLHSILQLLMTWF